ncbi:MAG: sugar transferase [Cyanothece sp. SIO1E1]|nr:sugar transferase [Cyanothece sp. SIO1E1]
MTSAFQFRNPKLDLRAPTSTGLRKGIVIDWLRINTLIFQDVAVLATAWKLAEIGSSPFGVFEGTHNPSLSLLLVIVTTVGFIAARGLYQSGAKRRDYWGLIEAVTFAYVLLLLVVCFYQSSHLLIWLTFGLGWCLSIFFICISRALADIVIEKIRQQGTACYPSLIICEPEDVDKSIQRLANQNRYDLLGWASISSFLRESNWQVILENIRYLGISEVFLCSQAKLENPMFFYWSLRNAGITLHILPPASELPVPSSELLGVNGPSATILTPPLITGSDFWMKRIFDFCCALLLLVLAAPVYGVIAILIKLDSPGPVFYKQTRIGLQGRKFKAWKFRTMVANAEQLQKVLEASNTMKDGVLFKLKDDPRITRVGKFLRQSSLDELPQVFNVLFGEMSLVGPRPLPERDIARFAEHHFIRHEVLPGITGLWQVSGRSDIDNFEDVVNLDVHYIENWSFWLDLQILLRTVKVVLQKTGAY